MAITDLEGTTYRGVSLVEPGHVAEFVQVTGDDPERWGSVAPPSYAAVLLFSVAPSFLWSDAVGDYSNILMHADQWFAYERAIRVGAPITTSATVDRIRMRNNMAWVTFSAVMEDSDSVVANSKSTFIMSNGQAPAEADEQEEPDPLLRGSNERASGKKTVQKSASRQDLVRYAAATSDFNPLHWDHATARSAGLPRVVAHGLLSASWAIQQAAARAEGDRPIESAKVRFKQPLLASDQAIVTTSEEGSTVTAVVESGGGVVVQAIVTL